MLIQLLVNKPELIIPYENTQQTIILMQDGIYSAQQLHKHFTNIRLFALEKDWRSAGLPEIDNVQLVSDITWVDMCSKAQTVITLQ